jgi:hypothetical protein
VLELIQALILSTLIVLGIIVTNLAFQDAVSLEGILKVGGFLFVLMFLLFLVDYFRQKIE